MHGRFFAGKQLQAEIYDGKTKYEKTLRETEEEEEKRMEAYEKWLLGQPSEDNNMTKNDPLHNIEETHAAVNPAGKAHLHITPLLHIS